MLDEYIEPSYFSLPEITITPNIYIALKGNILPVKNFLI
jgi:hypothetical protein